MMKVRLKEKYNQEVISAMMKKFHFKNKLQVPRLEKVVINMGVGEAAQNSKDLEKAAEELMLISGQKPVITKAKKSVSAFKIRAGMKIGCKVTIRGDRMFAFLDKLFHIVLPRIRDFRGADSNSFNGRSYSLGLREQLIFPEINYDKVEKPRGMDVTIVTTSGTNEEAREFLRLLGLPFRKN